MNKVVHFEIPTENPEKAVNFYGKVFGWELRKWGEMDYWLTNFNTPDVPGINGALTRKQGNNMTVVNTIDVENIEATLEAIKSNGGEVITPIMDIPNVGRMAYFKDTDGNILGAIQEVPRQI